MTAFTWFRDSHGLFDYECSKLSKTPLRISSNCILIRHNNEITLSYESPQSHLPENCSYLIALQLKEGNEHSGHFSLHSIESVCPTIDRSLCEKPWFSLTPARQSSTGKIYRLCERDVVKFGRVKLRVKEINSHSSGEIPNFCLGELLIDHVESEESDEDEGKNSMNQCRICLREINNAQNPLLSPCNCAGTMKYIHLRCLQRCLKSKITTRASDSVISLEWKQLECDLCMKALPYKLSVAGKVVDLVDIPKPPGGYIIFEILCKDKNSTKGLHVISAWHKQNISLGRGTDCDLKFSDISVSRNHATLRHSGGCFYLEDHRSKFGTLIQIKRPVAVENSYVLSVQFGRSLVNFDIRDLWSFLPSCFQFSRSPFDVFTIPVESSSVPLLPINTGIPMSVGNSEELLAWVGMDPRELSRRHDNRTLLYDHNQFGVNSSFEDSQEQDIEIEEVELLVDEAKLPLNSLLVTERKKVQSFSYN